MRRLGAPFIVAVLIASTVAAHAAITPQLESRARELMASGQAAAAYNLLKQAHEPASAGPQQWFILGLAAYRSGDLPAAERAFRAVLARDASSARAKLELARVLQESGAQQEKRQEAERLFREVRALNPPAQVAANIDRFLSLMTNRDETGHAWRARATIGAGYDSNVNQATKAHEANLFGLPFVLSRDARQRGDAFGFFRGELDAMSRFNAGFAWTSNLSFAARRHISAHDFDSYGLDIATGPMLQPGSQTTILLPLFASVRRFENSALASKDRFYSHEYGVAPQVSYAATSALTVNLTGMIAQRLYFEQSERNAQVYRAAPALDVRISPASVLSAGLLAGRETSRTSAYSKRSGGVTLGWRYAFAQNLVASLSASHERIAYDAAEAMNDRVRKDARTILGLDMIWAAQWAHGDLIFSYAHTVNASNLELYQFNRDLTSLSYRKTF